LQNIVSNIIRVFRKSDSSGVDPDNATHYYYTFSALAQEYDEHPVSEVPEDELEFDYLRGFDGHVLRRRDVEDADPDRQPLKDLLASPLNLVNADDGEMSAGTSGYTFDAWGESFEAGDTQEQPAENNHIRYHGAFAEEFVSPNDTDGVYRMGARHYSTVLGRFFQREPMTLVGLPSPANPLGVNAYLYSHNSPTTTSDISGLQMMNVSSGGILYPPEKPEVMPYEPLPDPDPGMEVPEGFPNKSQLMGLKCPWSINPWWDRRFPAVPLPDICMGINLPGFWATPELPQGPSIWDSLGGFMGSAERALAGAGGGRPYGPGRQFINVSGGGGGSSSGGGGLGRYYTGGWGIASDGSLITPGISVAGQSYQEGRNKDMADQFAENLALGSPEQRERLAIAVAGKEAADAELTAARRAYFWAGVDLALLVVDALTMGSSLFARRAVSGLVHLTSYAAREAITETAELIGRKGIYAISRGVLKSGSVGKYIRTGLRGGRIATYVEIPQQAIGLFKQPLPLGPGSALSRIWGHRVLGPGSLNIETGVFTSSQHLIGTRTMYIPDVIFYGGWFGLHRAGEHCQ